MKFKEWLSAKKSIESLEGKSADELAGLHNEFNEVKEQELQKAIDGKASKEDIDSLKSELKKNQNEQYKALNGALKEQGLAIKKFANIHLEAKKGESKEQVIKNYLTENIDQLRQIKNEASKAHLRFTVTKSMSIAGNVTGEIPQSFRESGMNRIQDRPTFVRNWIVNGSVQNTNLITWVEQQSRTGTTGGTAEGASKNEIGFDLVEASVAVKKRTNYIKVTKEMLDDIDFINSEIRNELLILLNLDIDNQLLQGDGTGTNLSGLLTLATTYSAGSFAGTINEANNYDVLRTAINQVFVNNFEPNVIFMNPTDLTAMQLTKGTDGHYTSFPFVSEDGQSILNIPIVWNNGVPAGTFLVMDGTKSTVFDRQAVTIDVGLDGNDFTTNFVTILAEWRGAQRIKGNHIGAFVTGDFTTAKAALETP